MGNCRYLCLYIQIAIALLLLSQISSTEASAYANNTGGCIARERSALIRFKAGLISYSADLLSSWQGDDCCGWKGVHCSKRTGHVIKLDLRSLHVPGTAPSLGGNISSSLLGLQRLQYLDLSNSWFGGHIPEFLPYLHNLRYLSLSESGFTGMIPPHLGNLSNLRYLSLGYDQTYSTDITWLQQLSSLEHLEMSQVNLSGIQN